MSEHAVLGAVATFLLAWALISKRVARWPITGPMVFMGFGIALSSLDPDLALLGHGGGALHGLAVATLLLVLFSDAARIDLRTLRDRAQIPLRMLALGLPAVLLLGTIAGWIILEGLGGWQLALLASLLMPTDAALGSAVFTDDRVPERIRTVLTTESGLNDGLALPVVLVLIACVESVHTGQLWSLLGTAGLQVTAGPLAGATVAVAGGWLLHQGATRGWVQRHLEQLASLSLAVMAYTLAEGLGGNGFVAAFVAGLTMGNLFRPSCEPLFDFAEAEGELLVLLMFLLFGLVLAPPAVMAADGRVWLYAIVSVLVVRPVAVRLSLVGAPATDRTKWFLGWFGPRGVASLLFALVVIEDGVPGRDEISAVVFVTVFASVVIHGASAAPLAGRLGSRIAREEAGDVGADSQPDGTHAP